MALVKATLTTVNEKKVETSDSVKVEVQFNPQQLQVQYRGSGPDSLTVTSGQSETPNGAGAGSSGQRTGYGSSLSTELFFDTSEAGKDVRHQTLEIVKMFLQPDRTTAPLVRFQWGTFVYYGRINSLSETLDYFSQEGVPLRATISLGMSNNEADKLDPKAAAGAAGAGLGLGVSAGISAGAGFSAGVSASIGVSAGISASAGIGTTPLTLSQSGDTLQSLSVRAGMDWKAVASANGVDNPRMVQAGTTLNLQAGANASASLSVKG